MDNLNGREPAPIHHKSPLESRLSSISAIRHRQPYDASLLSAANGPKHSFDLGLRLLPPAENFEMPPAA